MSVKLPRVLNLYIAAANSGDSESGSLCFSENATVLDEGETLKGRKEIRDWMIKTKKKYNHTTQPLQFREVGGASIVTSQVSGSFKGSPITLEHRFLLEDNLIMDLRVESVLK